MDSGEFRARAFAAVQFAADDFPSRDKLPTDFRLRFFRASFDPVDAWTIQLIMRGIAAADTHAGLVQSGRDLAATIRAHGPDGWNRLLGTAVAQIAPVPSAAANGEAKVQKAQFAVPAGPLPLPPQAIPGTRENRALTDATIKGIRKLGESISRPFESRRRDEDDDDLDEEGSAGDPAHARSHPGAAKPANRTEKRATSRRLAQSPSTGRLGRATIRQSRRRSTQNQLTMCVSRQTGMSGLKTRMGVGPITGPQVMSPSPAGHLAGRARNATAGQVHRGVVHVR